MAHKTVLQLAISYARQRGLPVPTGLAASTDIGALQLMELINKTGRDIVRRRNWQHLVRRRTVVLVGTEDQGTRTTFYGEDPIGVSEETIWNDNLKLPVSGPLSYQEYQEVKHNLPTGPFQCWTVYNEHVFITGSLTAGHVLSVMFKSRNWLTNNGATGNISEIAADTDVSMFPDDLMLLGLDYHYRKEKDMEYQTQLAAFVAALMDAEEVKPVLKMHETKPQTIRPGIIVPAGNWG